MAASVKTQEHNKAERVAQHRHVLKPRWASALNMFYGSLSVLILQFLTSCRLFGLTMHLLLQRAKLLKSVLMDFFGHSGAVEQDVNTFDIDMKKWSVSRHKATLAFVRSRVCVHLTNVSPVFSLLLCGKKYLAGSCSTTFHQKTKSLLEMRLMRAVRINRNRKVLSRKRKQQAERC